MIVLLIAIEVMYKPYEGSKHLLAFIIPAVLLLIAAEEIAYIRTFLIGVFFLLALILKRPDQADYILPYDDGSKEAEIVYWKGVYENIELADTKDPTYENTVIWTYGDGPDCWQLLYDLRSGMGISCCMSDYVIENFNSLQSGYIAAPAGGEIEILLESSPTWNKIGSSETMVLYSKVY